MDFNKHPKETERLLESRLEELRAGIKEKEGRAPTRGECTQPEAFCLMHYASRDGSVTEVLWNSRDGVTPFCITAKDGKTELTHVDWGADKFAPGHKLMPGDRYFGPLTRGAAEKYALARIESMDGTPYEVQGEERAYLFKQIVEEMLKDETPDILVFQGDEEQKQYEELKAEQSNKVPGGLVEWVRKKLVDAQEAYEISHIHTCSAKHTPNRDELMECVAHQKQMEGRRDVFAEVLNLIHGEELNLGIEKVFVIFAADVDESAYALDAYAVADSFELAEEIAEKDEADGQIQEGWSIQPMKLSRRLDE